MEYAVIIFGLLSIGCTCMLFLTIGTFSRKISEIHKAIAKIHVKTMELESSFNAEKKNQSRVTYEDPRKKTSTVRKEVVYKIPKKITGDLIMEHSGKLASVQATLKVKETE